MATSSMGIDGLITDAVDRFSPGASVLPSTQGRQNADQLINVPTPRIGADGRPVIGADGTVYIALDAGAEALVQRSDDDGKTWSAPISIARSRMIVPARRESTTQTLGV